MDAISVQPTSPGISTAAMRSGYSYQPLPEHALRLVRLSPTSTPTDIHCTLEHRNDYGGHNGDPYTALSYCWGDSSNTASITLDGSPFYITVNLWKALSAIVEFHDASKVFWIDMICIDQDNIEERNHQVKQMWRIFSAAEKVYAWLGSEVSDTQLVYNTIRRLARGCEAEIDSRGICPRGQNHKRMSKWATLVTFLLATNDYFTRAWTLVEVINAQHLTMLCGRHSFDSRLFIHAMLQLQRHKYNIPVPHDFLSFVTARNRAAVRAQVASADERSIAYPKFMEIFSIFSSARCSDPRDKIFAMLGDLSLRSASFVHDLGPDYRWTVDELVLIVLEVCGKLTLYERRPGEDAGVAVASVLPLLTRAFGSPEEPDAFRTWFNAHEGWLERFKEKKTVKTNTGRDVDCTGRFLQHLLDERHIRLRTTRMRVSNGQAHIEVFEADNTPRTGAST